MSEAILSSGALVIFLMFMAYMVFGSLIEKHKCIVGHEASYIILVGIAISYGSYFVHLEEFTHMMTFD
jgi:predicted tellurium resistance membrane protein TerC